VTDEEVHRSGPWLQKEKPIIDRRVGEAGECLKPKEMRRANGSTNSKYIMRMTLIINRKYVALILLRFVLMQKTHPNKRFANDNHSHYYLNVDNQAGLFGYGRASHTGSST